MKTWELKDAADWLVQQPQSEETTLLQLEMSRFVYRIRELQQKSQWRPANVIPLRKVKRRPAAFGGDDVA